MAWTEIAGRWKAKLSDINWYLCLGLSFLFCVILGLSAGAFKLHQLLNDAKALPIEAVAISGDRNKTTDREIQIALQNLMQSSFFSADINQVRAAIEELPWVYQASVRRDWPAKLKVYLLEQEVVAHWNGDGWLNVHGEIFFAPARGIEKPLPILAGPENEAKLVLTSYQQIDELLTINGFSLKSLTLSPRHAWFGVLDNGIQIQLGREDKMARVQRFINVYPMLAKQKKKVAKVDLRYDTGLAVSWDQAKEENQ